VTRFVAPALLLAVAGFVVGCAQGSGPRLNGDAGVEDGMVDGKPSVVDAAAPDGCVASAETCNAKDDDCDGATDEDLGLGMPCDGADSDGCKEGMVVCDGAGATTCDDMTTDTLEICNGLDDDCQNGADDTYPVGQACSVGVGACASTGMRVCDMPGTGTTCTAMSGSPTAETCGNSIDEDCSGADVTCPGNDTAAGAINISAGGQWSVDLSAAHDDNFAPSTAALPRCGSMGGRDAFFQFSLPAEEVVYYDTYGSNFDTVVRIFAGSCTSLGATLVCSDDSCETTRSIGAVDLSAGTYCLVVDQYSSNTTGGMATLTFRRGGRPGTPLTFTSTDGRSGSISGTTTGKANLSVASCETNTNQGDVGHFFLTCPSFTYTVDASTCTGTSYDSVLYLRTGAATSADVACSDDVSGCGSNLQSRFTGATVVGGNLHWLIVDGFGSTGNGSYSLTYTVQ
jgi:hypothetical protein